MRWTEKASKRRQSQRTAPCFKRLVMMVLLLLFISTFSFEKSLFFLFFLPFCRTLRVQSLHLFTLLELHVRQVPDEVNEFPRVPFIVIGRAPSWHSSKADSVLDNVEQLAIAEVLSRRSSHVRRRGIHLSPHAAVTASVISVARGAVVGPMPASFVQSFWCFCHWV